MGASDIGAAPAAGHVVWIGARQPRVRNAGSQGPTAPGPIHAVETIEIDSAGLVGDRHRAAGGKRAVTLIQAEHLPVIRSLLAAAAVTPESLRRNLVVAGINLKALERCAFRVGEVVLEGTGPCHPCGRMEDALGPGGYAAMRGHGGITARVLCGGTVRVGDPVAPDHRLRDPG